MATFIILLVVVAALAGSSKGGGAAGKLPKLPPGIKKPGGIDTPTPTPGGGKLPPKPDPFLVPGSGEWGDGELPDWFDTNLNHFYISPDCEYIAEGKLFETSAEFIVNAVEAGTLVDALMASDPAMPVGTNSVYGFLDYLVTYEGFTTAEELALRVMMEANALCADVAPEQWTEAQKMWFTDFTNRIRDYMDLEAGEIPFAPGG